MRFCLYCCAPTNRKCVCVYPCNGSYSSALLCHVRLFPPCSRIPVSEVFVTANISHSCIHTNARIAKRLEYWIFVSFRRIALLLLFLLFHQFLSQLAVTGCPRNFLPVTQATQIVPPTKTWKFLHPKISGKLLTGGWREEGYLWDTETFVIQLKHCFFQSEVVTFLGVCSVNF